MVELEIDGRMIEAAEGERLLWAATDAGIYIPHLCAGREIDYHPGSCRLCWVEVEGYAHPVLSCTERVRPGLVVRTRSEAVDRLVRSGFALLMSTHRLNCGECPGNKRCALQEMTKQRKVPLRPRRIEWGLVWSATKAQPEVVKKARAPLTKLDPEHPIDDSHPLFGLDRNHCVLCGKCVHVCNNIVKCRVLDFHRRGLATIVTTFQDRPLADQPDCTGCLACVKVCPVGALYQKNK